MIKNGQKSHKNNKVCNKVTKKRQNGYRAKGQQQKISRAAL
jgi:hypothetical protein